MFDLGAKQYMVLSRITLGPVHVHASAADMVNDMLNQALRIDADTDNDSTPVPDNAVDR